LVLKSKKVYNLKKISVFVKQQEALNLLIGSTVVLFLLAQILIALHWFSLRYIALPIELDVFLKHWWTIITYGFFHQDFLALFFNMLLLFYFGSILSDFKPGQKIWQIYLSGIFLGAVFFLLSYRWLPDFYVKKGPLLGASAGVMAVMTYATLLTPHYQIKIRFLGYFKLVHILIFFVLFNLLQIPLGNPGGYFAHLGGLTAGFIWFWIDQSLKRKNTTTPFNHIQKPKLQKETEIDRILDKISRSGYESLTDEEKAELFKQSNK